MPGLRMRGRRSGFTLVELIVALVISSIVAASAIRMTTSMTRQSMQEAAYVNAEESIWITDTALRTALRLAAVDAYGSGLARVYADPFATGTFDAIRVVSDFNPADGDTSDLLEDITFQVVADTLRVRWRAGTAFVPYVHPIRSLSFQYFKADGTAATTQAQVDSAARVTFTMISPTDSLSSRLVTRQSWAYLRNR